MANICDAQSTCCLYQLEGSSAQSDGHSQFLCKHQSMRTSGGMGHLWVLGRSTNAVNMSRGHSSLFLFCINGTWHHRSNTTAYTILLVIADSSGKVTFVGKLVLIVWLLHARVLYSQGRLCPGDMSARALLRPASGLSPDSWTSGVTTETMTSWLWDKPAEAKLHLTES